MQESSSIHHFSPALDNFIETAQSKSRFTTMAACTFYNPIIEIKYSRQTCNH